MLDIIIGQYMVEYNVSEIIFRLCELNGIEVEVIKESEDLSACYAQADKTYEGEFAELLRHSKQFQKKINL